MAAPKRNPTPSTTPPLQLASRLGADQQQARQEASWQDAARSQKDQKVLLEQEPRSYARPEKTEQESEQARQQGMSDTAAQLSPDGLNPEEASGDEDVPPESGIRPRRDTASEEEQLAEEEQAEREEIERAQQFQRLQQEEIQMQHAEQQTAQTEQAANLVLQTKKEWQNIRQFSEAASGMGIILLVLELNAQTIATLLNIRIPGLQKASKPRMALTALLDVSVCLGMVAMYIPFIITVLLVWWALENPAQAFISFISAKFGL